MSPWWSFFKCGYLVRARFLSQPPEDLRKSNFFNFTIELRAGGELVDIQEPQFVHFLNEDHCSQIRNGIRYRLRLRYSNGTIEEKYLFLTLVDASTSEPIRYEGHDDNPKMQRVLLTHEAICTRCSLQKSCGNKNEAPSDPLLVSKGVVKFFLKCNQNCLKVAGNPRAMRRFAIAVSFEDITNDQSKICALSTKMFVHNNSKHNRKRKKDILDIKPIAEPSEIAYIHPRIGTKESTFAFYSKDWSREGVSFRWGHFDLFVTSIIPNVGLTVHLPYSLQPGKSLITLYFENEPVFSFPYEIQERYYTEMKPASLGFLCLYRHTRSEYQINVGTNNFVAHVIDPPQHPVTYNFSNGSCPSVPLHYPPNHNYSFNSTPPSSEGSHISGTDSSPTYPTGF